jgi:hypothetical protein
VSIPLAFLLGMIGSFVGRRDRGERQRAAAMEVRALTGIGANRPSAPAAAGTRRDHSSVSARDRVRPRF